MIPIEDWLGIEATGLDVLSKSEGTIYTIDPLLSAWAFDELEVKPEERERYRQWRERHVRPDENLRGTGRTLVFRASDWEKEGKS